MKKDGRMDRIGGNDGVIRFAQQRTVPTRAQGRQAADIAARLTRAGVPASVCDKVLGILYDCMAKIVAAIGPSPKAVGRVAASTVNLITVCGQEYMLRTSGGKVIYLKNNRMTSLLLMLILNPGVSVSRALLHQAEKRGPWQLSRVQGRQAPGVIREESPLHREDDCHPDGEHCGPATDPKTLDACRKRLKEIGIERMHAEEDGDHEKISKLDREVRDIKRYKIETTCKPVPNAPVRIRVSHSHDVAADMRRLHMAFERIIAIIGDKDEELGAFLNVAITRNGTFCYTPAPSVRWEVRGKLVPVAPTRKQSRDSDGQSDLSGDAAVEP